MAWMDGLRARLRLLFGRRAAEERMDEEIRFHLEMEVEKNLAGGMSPGEARRRAMLAFGGVEKAREGVRDEHAVPWLDGVAKDVGYAVRSFRSGRSGLLIPVAVLAVAIGAGTTTFSVVSAVLLDSLPFGEPERLVKVGVLPRQMATTDDVHSASLSRASLELLLSSSGAFESAAYHTLDVPVVTGLGEPERVQSSSVAPSFFEVLGTRALLGRTLGASDASEGAAPIVVSHGFWRSRLGGARDVLGHTFRVDGRVHEVVGVMPPGFAFPEGTELWRPAPPLAPVDTTGTRDIQGTYHLVARLAPGLAREQARARIEARFAAFAREHENFASWRPALGPLRELITGPIREPLLLLMGAVALVLLIACANVAAVLLARGITRRRELAIRLSMGATRARVARQLLIESVLLALLSGVAGTLLALAGVPLLTGLMGSQLPGTAQIEIDGRVLAATLLASTITGLVAGLLPALLAAREELSATLRDGSAGSGTSSWRTRVGEGLVVLQVGLGTVLMTAAMLLAVSFVNLTRVDFGFDPPRVAVAHFSLDRERYSSPEQRSEFIDQVTARVTSLPGVEAAAVSTGIPFEGDAVGTVEVSGEEVPPGAPLVWFTEATPDFFRTLGVPFVRGRAFTRGGRLEPGAVVVNEAFVREYLGGADPIGRIIRYYGGSVEARIVGVVADTRQTSAAEPPAPQLYTPLQEAGRLKVIVRAAGDAGELVGNLKQAIRAVDPLLPIDRVGVLSDLVGESISSQRLHAVVVSTFAAIALLITALGIYGLSAYSVSRRSREIAVRLSLGATARHIRATTLGRATMLAGAGVVLGLVGAWAGARLLDAFVFGLATRDPRVFLGVALLLTLAAIVAAYAPARRAARIDPMLVLRAD